jgi:hypothetical protein
VTGSQQQPQEEVDHLPPVDQGADDAAQTVEPDLRSQEHDGYFDNLRATGPRRIQRLLTAGWRMPLDAVYVGRPTPWGNPFPVTDVFSRADAVRMHRELVLTGETWHTEPDGTRHHFTRKVSGPLNVPTLDTIRRVLAGRDLACWCPLDEACHADTLLELANP